MTLQENIDVAHVLTGYEGWRARKAKEFDLGQHLSISAYVDDLAKLRAVDVVREIQELYADASIPQAEIDAEVKRLVGVE